MKKNSIFMTGMLALLLTFGLVLAGCPNGNDDDDDGGGGGSGGITISDVSASYGWIYIDVGNGLSHIDASDFDLQKALISGFQVTVDGSNYAVVAVMDVGASVNGVSSRDLVLAVGNTTFKEGTEYTIKIKYTKGTTPIAFDDGSGLDSFEIEETITAD
jgi:hypothetical protein